MPVARIGDIVGYEDDSLMDGGNNIGDIIGCDLGRRCW